MEHPAPDGTCARGRRLQAACLLWAGWQQCPCRGQHVRLGLLMSSPAGSVRPRPQGAAALLPVCWVATIPLVVMGRSSSASPAPSHPAAAGNTFSDTSWPPSPWHFWSPESPSSAPKSYPSSAAARAAQLRPSKRPPVPKLIVKEKSEQLL